MKAFLSQDVTIIDYINENGLIKQTELILPSGTEIMVDIDASIALAGDIYFDIEPSEYNSIN